MATTVTTITRMKQLDDHIEEFLSGFYNKIMDMSEDEFESVVSMTTMTMMLMMVMIMTMMMKSRSEMMSLTNDVDPNPNNY